MSCQDCKAETSFQCEECEDYCCNEHWYTYNRDRICKNCVKEVVSWNNLLSVHFTILLIWASIVYVVFVHDRDFGFVHLSIMSIVFVDLPTNKFMEWYFGEKHPINNQFKIWR